MDFDDDSCECIEEDVLDPETIRKGKEILQTHTQTLGSQWICILYLVLAVIVKQFDLRKMQPNTGISSISAMEIGFIKTGIFAGNCVF